MTILKEYILILIFFHLFVLQNNYLFSVIIPIYNSGRYLNDSINSILHQTLGLHKIQLILVNDGSIDNSDEICFNFQNQYYKNIIYIKMNHFGASKARNVGFKYSKGIFINFLDSDDKWDYNAFKQISLFFKYNNNINYVAGRIIYFEAINKFHPLDYKFNKTRIVNLTKEYNCIQLQASSSIFKKSILKRLIFDEEISYSEDTKLINTILLINPIMGIVKEAIYYYRKRKDFSSALQTKANSFNFYFESLNSVFIYFINTSIILYNKIVPFIQFLVSYELFYRIKSPAFKFLDLKNFKKYITLIEYILKKIEDKYILEQRVLSNKYKLFILSKKYHKDIRYQIQVKNNSFLYSNFVLINFSDKKHIISLRIMKIYNNILYLEAKDNFFMPKKSYFYFCKLGDKIFYPKYIENSIFSFFTLYGLIEKGRIISFEIPIELSNTPLVLYFYLSYLDNIIEIFPYLGIFTHIPGINNGYYINDNFIIKYLSKRLIIFCYSKKLEISFESLYLYELKKAGKANIIKLRKKYFNYNNKIRNGKNSEIWIINDDLDRAGGNGEYFFRYLKLKKPKLIKPYFAILKNCSDFKRLKKIDGILDINSNKYKLIFLESNKIISSVLNPWTYNPFNKNNKYIRDLFHFDFIYIPNFISKVDISNYINKFGKNFFLVTTSSKKEYKDILNLNYEYNEDKLILTGMPRYDNIQRLKKLIVTQKKILIMPAYRANIKGKSNFITGEKVFSDIFNYKNFFYFYNKLINDKNLLLNMEKFNYFGIFCLNPFFDSQRINFKQNKFFSIIRECDSQKLLLESSLLITDFSPIFFDFGYLFKPVIYIHFNNQDYIYSYRNEDPFDYNIYGFGPICHNIQCTVNEITFELENNCILRKRYLNKAKKFFSFFDEKNSERLYKEISKKKQKLMNNIIKYNTIYFCVIIISVLILIKIILINFFFYKNK